MRAQVKWQGQKLMEKLSGPKTLSFMKKRFVKRPFVPAIILASQAVRSLLDSAAAAPDRSYFNPPFIPQCKWQIPDDEALEKAERFAANKGGRRHMLEARVRGRALLELK